LTTVVQTDKEYHLKRLEELSEKSLGQIPELDELNEEQQAWIKRKMKGRFV
jgi:parvulin-like peptidyl-prolyl isomerase